MTSADLAADILRFTHDTCAAAMERYLPGRRVPGYFAGYRITQDFAVDLAYTLSLLHRAGFASVGDRPIASEIATILSQIDGSTIKTFYSYRVAETLLAFGGLKDNPLLTGLGEDQVHGLHRAIDTTSIYDAKTGTLPGHANNFWCVLARCEYRRNQLAPLADDSIYRAAVERSRELLFRNPCGFFDDDVALGARYDSYSADVLLFVDPIWDLLDRDRILRVLETHIRLLESVAMPNGACIAWGRTSGAHSVCLTAELAAAGVLHGFGDSVRLLNLAHNAFTQFRSEWMRDDLIAAHRDRMTDGYRGPHRLLQMTFDCLGKWVCTAVHLREIARPIDPLPALELFPPRDEFTSFEKERPVGVWMFRRGTLEFQVPVVAGYNADYAASPHAPHLFENPVDSPMLCGAPRVFRQGVEYRPLALPQSLHHAPGRLTIEGQPLVSPTSDNQPVRAIGYRDVTWQVEEGTLVIDERWTFTEPPEALSYAIAETAVPLLVAWQTETSHSSTVIEVSGMHGCVTAWSRLRRLHEIDFTVTGPTVALQVRITASR